MKKNKKENLPLGGAFSTGTTNKVEEERLTTDRGWEKSFKLTDHPGEQKEHQHRGGGQKRLELHPTSKHLDYTKGALRNDQKRYHRRGENPITKKRAQFVMFNRTPGG